jgi:hypothetical protein
VRPDSAIDPVIADERRHLTASRAALGVMRASAAQIFDEESDELSSFALGRLRGRRLAALADDPRVPPFFGRLDVSEESFHIGRRHVRDGAGAPLVIDWRAPIARLYYRATRTEPAGVRRRRRFGFADGELTAYEDEYLDRDGDFASDMLRAEIERPRVGPMRDIVATIQPAQDEIVRADLGQSTCVQGVPGTGKTAVGLHRAAYLLYAHAEQLRRAGVLVVGPNRAFLGYIGAVLPTLGEIGVMQLTIDELVDRGPIRALDPPAAAAVKADARMAAVLRRALYARLGRPTDSIMVPMGSRRYRVPPEPLRRWIDDLRRTDVRYLAARDQLRSLIAADIRRQREEDGGAPSDAETARVARSAPVRDAVDALWPKVDALTVLAEVLTDPTAAAGDLLTPEECAALTWPKPPTSPKRARLTAGDVVLLDELADLLERTPGFGHVVVDEAQDLSPMQCRAIARRCATGSMTVLGDLAQGTTLWASPDWAATLKHLGKPDAALVQLTEGYRAPKAVLDLANRLLPAIAPDLPPATAVRDDTGPVRVVQAHPVATAVVEEVRAALALPGSVGVIVADDLAAAVAGSLADGGIAHRILSADDEAPAARTTVTPATLAKGLEFDHVVLVEPAAIADGPRGCQRLYVALTRAVSRLAIVHSADLPAELRADPSQRAAIVSGRAPT